MPGEPVVERAYSLSCPHCGAALDVPPGIQHCTCRYCGSALRIAEEGGVVFLRLIARDVKSIRETVDRTEATLANLSKDFRELTEKLPGTNTPRVSPSPTSSGCFSVGWMVIVLPVGLAFFYALAGFKWTVLFWAPLLLAGFVEFVFVNQSERGRSRTASVFAIWIVLGLCIGLIT